jgi:hypothetical protein
MARASSSVIVAGYRAHPADVPPEDTVRFGAEADLLGDPGDAPPTPALTGARR